MAADALASANGLFTFGGVMGQGTQGLVANANFEEMISVQRQAAAAATRAMAAARVAERTGSLAVNIANQAVERARSMASLEDQNVHNP